MSVSIELAKGTYYNVVDAAALLGVTTGRIRQMIRDGVLESIKVTDRAHLIREKDLKQHLEPRNIGRPRKINGSG